MLLKVIQRVQVFPVRRARSFAYAACLALLAALVWVSVLEMWGLRSERGLLAGRTPSVLTFGRDGQRITDGVIAPQGSPWNSELASVISLGGSVEWDLGSIVPIQKVLLQADNDDTYALVVSTDRKHWDDLWEAPPVNRPGLATRTADALHAAARYVRVEPRGGDGSYSITELALSGNAAEPWPPALDERAVEGAEVPGEKSRERQTLLAFALALGSLGVVWLMGRRKTTPELARPRGPLSWVTLVIALFVSLQALSYAAQNRFNLVDDTYISLQYAKNLVTGQGLVFNPGERVEGFTNFLWTLLMAPLWLLSGKDPGLMARAATWVALGCAITSLGLVTWIGRRALGKSALPTVFALLVVACDDSFLAYPTLYALENQLLMALMLGAVGLSLYRPARYELWLGVLFALIGMTRPDGLLFGGSFLLVHAFKERRLVVRVGLPFALVFAAYFLARYAYYGELLPNTFHLKVGSSLEGLQRGFDYLRSFVSERAWVPLLALPALVFGRSRWVVWVLLHALLHAAYVVYVGGDFYAGHRFLLALVPSLALLSAVTFARLLERTENLAPGARGLLGQRALLGAAVLTCTLVRYRTLERGASTVELNWATPIVDNNVQYMRWLGEVARPNASMVVGDIGATGLFADVRVIDYFGVVDREVARKQVPHFGTGKAGHEKVLTREEQLARQPTYIKWGYVGDASAPPGYYIFNDFPRHLRVEGLWVKDDLSRGQVLRSATAFHFDRSELSTFTRSGTAFQGLPHRGRAPEQTYVVGARGALINTFRPGLGDSATGVLRSSAFTLEGDRMRLLVGGGRDPERLRVSLVIDGKRAFSETGTNWETLGRREWEIAAYRGKTAYLEIVDNAVGAWGHILVDEVEQWSGTPNTSGRL